MVCGQAGHDLWQSRAWFVAIMACFVAKQGMLFVAKQGMLCGQTGHAF
jgi:hypothetical protein